MTTNHLPAAVCDLIRPAFNQVDLNPTRVAKRLLDVLQRDVALGMILAEVLAVGGIPDDWPFVLPESIYMLSYDSGWVATSHGQTKRDERRAPLRGRGESSGLGPCL